MEKNFQTVQLADNREAVMLAPNLNDGQKLAIISQTMLKRLSKLLPKAPFREIKDDFINAVQESTGLDEMITVITDELDFHNSVRNVNVYFQDGRVAEPVA